MKPLRAAIPDPWEDFYWRSDINLSTYHNFVLDFAVMAGMMTGLYSHLVFVWDV